MLSGNLVALEGGVQQGRPAMLRDVCFVFKM